MAKKKGNTESQAELFIEQSGQIRLLNKSAEQQAIENRPVECFGMTFDNDQKRREYFTEKLREKLKDSEFRKIEGFPIGTEEDILALSDPPYYTACPNPWLADFVKSYGSSYDSKKLYHREPFATDVSEGKTHPIYTAHGYHTKVPHRAIMRFILHYTHPGDVIFDGFAGTGMAGVAAQLCGDQAEVRELGYRIDDQGSIVAEDGKTISKMGIRRAILNDLSPTATFISQNFLLGLDIDRFEAEAQELLDYTAKECGWMFETHHGKDRVTARINYTVWSDVFSCPECGGEIVFTEEAVDEETKTVKEELHCPHCTASLQKGQLELRFESRVDPITSLAIKIPKRKPVLINYSVGGTKHEKTPDSDDLATLEKVANLKLPVEMPILKLPEMQMARVGRVQTVGITHLHHFFLPRQAQALAVMWRRATAIADTRLRNSIMFFVEQAIWGLSVLNRYSPSHFSQVNRALSGVFYVASQISEVSPWYNLEGKLKRLIKALRLLPRSRDAAIVTTQDCGALDLPDSSVDYIFTDPPFGENIYYSDLNLLVEAWYGVLTNCDKEAIVDRARKKGLSEYQRLMERCFHEYYRILKPGRWITVEFSNSQAAVWNAIQTTLQDAGFIVASVAALDKQQRSFQSVTSPTAVKQDLVISAYKPNGGLEERFTKGGGTEDGVWDVVRTHLNNLPVVKLRGGQLEFITERDPRILYDRVVAFHVVHSKDVPLSSAEFQAGLAEKFPERDGMYFLPAQVTEYDKKRAQMDSLGQIKIFVEDERSAIDWLRNFLKDRPSTYQDIQPEFMRQLSASWKKWELRPELNSLLDQNFLSYDGQGEVPSQIHSYLSTQFKEMRKLAKDDSDLRSKAKSRWYVPDPKKNIDIETLRNKHLLEEFWTYLPDGYNRPLQNTNTAQATLPMPELRPKIPVGKRLKELRTEAIRVGFKHCWQNRDYATIIAVASRIPESVLQEDPKLLMWYDHARTRTEGV